MLNFNKNYLYLRGCLGLDRVDRQYRATVTRTTTWSSGDTLTASALNAEFNNLLNALALGNADIAGGAAIAYSKLNLTGSILNADISASAGIAESKILFATGGHGHTGGTDGKAITPSVTGLSGCSVHLSANQSITNGVATKVQFNTELYDLGSEFDSSTNHRFTVGTAGKYLICFTPLIMALADGKVLTAAIHKNGSAINSATFPSNGNGGNMGGTLAIIANLSASDYIEFFVTHDDTTARNLAGGATATAAMAQRVS